MRIAPNPWRVRIFLAEKGVTVPFEQVDTFRGDTRTSEFLGKNPLGAVPVLELDDGICIAESVAICRYFEGFHPNLSLMGTGTLGQGSVEMWQRRMEFNVFLPIEQIFLHSSQLFKSLRKWLNLLRYAARRPIRASNGWTRCSRRAAMLPTTFTPSPTLQF
jgi:glutathione S-transferase